MGQGLILPAGHGSSFGGRLTPADELKLVVSAITASSYARMVWSGRKGERQESLTPLENRV